MTLHDIFHDTLRASPAEPCRAGGKGPIGRAARTHGPPGNAALPFSPARRCLIALAAGLGLCLGLARPGFGADAITVFAAASLKNAMDEIAGAFERETGHAVTVSLAGSSALARQIQHGAPADIFISANPGWMDALEQDGLIEPDSRFDLLRNTIVLIAHGRDARPVEIRPGLDIAGMLGEGRLAMTFVDAVPAGLYGKAALRALGVWETVRSKVAQADNVRAALALVSSGEAPLGIVYATDAAADDNVTVLGAFPARSYPPVVYPAAAVAASGNPLNARFLAWLSGQVARKAFERQGFVVAFE
ncbi:MAG: molybdate ABC transporter substrate-binding protein [Alphaproteobacteria bacterium]|nr:molybdate ABC transporter substrate-binding protein [Alphaproteobacteria bacterium]